MGGWDGRVNVLVIGGGMISQEVVLPTIFQQRRIEDGHDSLNDPSFPHF